MRSGRGKECPFCGTMCSEGSDFCPHCGTLYPSAGDTACTDHSSRQAAGVCVICQQPFCVDCLKRVDGRFLCARHMNVKIEQEFALVYSSSNINDAELARAILDERGFHVVVRDFTPIGYVWDGAGDSALSRSLLRKLAKIYVPIPDYMRALVVLNEWSTGSDASADGGQ